MRRTLLTALLVSAPVATPAQAITLFSNDFSTGLGPNEAVRGAFAVGQGYVGHQRPYAISATDSYTVAVDNSGYASSSLSFAYDVDVESVYDLFRVYNVAQDGTSDLAVFTGRASGIASYELARDTTAVRFVFTSDASINYLGVKLDDVRVIADGFANDFSRGLSQFESVSGGFSIANGTIGHQGTNYAINATDTYSINFDASSYLDGVLSFDYDIQIEDDYDGLQIFGTSNMGRQLLTRYRSSEQGSSYLALLSGTTKIDFVFNSDASIVRSGVKLDNVRIFDRGVAAVPEPATWGMMLLGFGLAGASMRRRRSATVTYA